MKEFTPRVAFFTDSFHESNGVARTSREFAGYARASFFPFLAVYPGCQTAHFRRGSYEAFELAPSRAALELEHDLTFDILFFRHARRLRRILTAFEPDLIHITGPGHCGMLGAILAHNLGIPLVASWHTNVHEYGARRIARSLRRLPAPMQRVLEQQIEERSLDLTLRFYRLAKLLFAPNLELCAVLHERTDKTVHLMERGIDCDLFTPARRTPNKRPFTIGYVGRLSAEKNVRLLVPLERKLRETGLRDYRFQIVGDGSERAWLQEHIVQGVFPGLLHGESLASAYANMDVFVFPSETDTYGNVVKEALASGVPCVVSGRGGPRFLIEPGHTGLIASSLEDYVLAVLGLQADAARLDHMRANARAVALTRSWSTVFDSVYHAYRIGFKDRTLPRRIRPSQPSTMRFRSV